MSSLVAVLRSLPWCARPLRARLGFARRTLPLVVAVPALAGCYRLTPIETDAQLASGTELRIELTDAGAVRLASMVGPRVEVIDGRTLENTDTSVVVAVTETINRARIGMPWNGERVEVPRTAIDRLRARELDRGRSWLAGAAGVAGIFLLSRVFDWGGGSDAIPGRPGGGPQQGILIWP